MGRSRRGRKKKRDILSCSSDHSELETEEEEMMDIPLTEEDDDEGDEKSDKKQEKEDEEDGPTSKTSTPTTDKPKEDVGGSDVEQLIQQFEKLPLLAEEYAMEFICKELGHPVVSCFRELSGADVSLILHNLNKLRKMGSVEFGVLCLGLLDYMAYSLKNPLYLQKGSMKIPVKAQRCMIEFHKVMTSWGLAENEDLKKRYDLVKGYLRHLVPRFELIGFGEKFGSILDEIEKMISTKRQRLDMIRTMNSSSNKPTSSEEVMAMDDGEVEVTEEKIELKFAMEIDDDEDEEDEENSPVKASAFIAVATSASNANQNPKSALKKIDDVKNALKKNDTKTEKNTLLRTKSAGEISPTKYPLKTLDRFISNSNPTSSTSPRSAVVKESNKLATISHPSPETTSNPMKTVTIKDDDEESLRKKPRLMTDENSDKSANNSNPLPKPKIDAFAFLMNKSKELAKKKKTK